MKTLCGPGKEALEVICAPVNGPEMFNETAPPSLYITQTASKCDDTYKILTCFKVGLAFLWRESFHYETFYPAVTNI